MELVKDEDDSQILAVGEMCRGQAWVELHGCFTAEALRTIADDLERNCKGLNRCEHQE